MPQLSAIPHTTPRAAATAIVLLNVVNPCNCRIDARSSRLDCVLSRTFRAVTMLCSFVNPTAHGVFPF
jgi:hypothetical protein